MESERRERAVELPGIEIPEEMRQLRQCSSETKFKTKLMLDGVAGLSRTLKMVKPIKTVEFFENLRITHLRGSKYKGFKILQNKSCYQLDCCTVGPYTISIVFPVEIAIPFTYLEYPKFSSRIYRILRESINKIYQNQEFDHHSGLSTPMKVHPEEWESFSDSFEETLLHQYQEYNEMMLHLLKQNQIDINRLNTAEYKNPIKDLKRWDEFKSLPFSTVPNDGHFYFHVQRMGQDLEIPDTGTKLIDPNCSTEEALRYFESWKDRWTVFDYFQIHESEFQGCRWLSFHIAKDFESENQQNHLVWIEKEVNAKFKANYDVYNVFCVPGVANLVRHLVPLEDSIRYLQLYCRFGHEFHRNSTGIFTKSMIVTKRVVEMLGVKTLPSKIQKKTSTNNVDTQIKRNIPVKQVRNWIDDSGTSGSSARLEIVFEVDTSDKEKWAFVVDKENSRFFSWMLLTSLMEFLSFIDVRKLSSPTLLMEVPCKIMQMWLQKALRPCCNVIENVINALESSTAENLDTIFYNLQDVLYSEAIICFFIRGALPSGFPEVLNTDLRFIEMQLQKVNYFKKLGDHWKIANVEITADEFLTVIDIPKTIVNKMILEWFFGTSFEKKFYSNIKKSFQNLRHTSVGIKSQFSKHYVIAVKKLAQEIPIFIQKMNSVFDLENIDCEYARTEAMKNVLTFNKLVIITPSQLWRIISDRSREPNTATTFLVSLLEDVVNSDQKLTNQNQRVSLQQFFVEYLDESICREECPFFCWFVPEELCCVFPSIKSALGAKVLTTEVLENCFRRLISAFPNQSPLFKILHLDRLFNKSDVFKKALSLFLKDEANYPSEWINTPLCFKTSPYQQFLAIYSILFGGRKDPMAKKEVFKIAETYINDWNENTRFISLSLLEKLISIIK